jgi:hypothetical protein
MPPACCAIPTLATARMRNAARIARHRTVTMDTPDRSLLSINTATLRKQWDLRDIIAGPCADAHPRHLARGAIQVAQIGVKESATRIRDAGPGRDRLLPRRHVHRDRSRRLAEGPRRQSGGRWTRR